MTEKPQILEYRSSKLPSVLPTSGMEQNLGNARGAFCLAYACKTRVDLKTETMMRMKWMLTTFILMGMAALTGTAAYGQAGRPCPRCGRPIVREAFMNRSSYRCPHCQRTPRHPHP